MMNKLFKSKFLRFLRRDSRCYLYSSQHEQSLSDVAFGKILSAQLTHRSLLRVFGADSRTFLQGLVTADVNTLGEQRALYSMILNPQGRVLYDIILYHRGDGDQLLECDSQAISDIIKHLKRYTLRAKVEISSADTTHKVWALFPGSTEGCSPLENSDSVIVDPRLSEFGFRVITDSSTNSLHSTCNAIETTIDKYHTHRLMTGLAEGIEEVPTASCFPLEYNLDLLQGVSFDKGCYVGQELTARTHHTGVVRKRVMPVTLSKSPKDPIPGGSPLVNSNGKTMGKLICHRADVGLALLRVKESLQSDVILKSDSEPLQVLSRKPNWWPSDLVL